MALLFPTDHPDQLVSGDGQVGALDPDLGYQGIPSRLVLHEFPE
jgi:hypothetical protein